MEKAETGVSQTDKQRRKNRRILPSARIAFTRQLDILRAYAIASGETSKSVTNSEVGKIADVVPSTVSLANAFFNDAGFIQKSGAGYIPAPEVISFSNAYKWAPDTALRKLAPIVARSWFAEVVLPKLRMRSMELKDVIHDLAEAAVAEPKQEPQLKMLVDYLEKTNFISVNGTQVQTAVDTGSVQPQPTKEDEGQGTKEPQPIKPSSLAPGFLTPAQGVIQFNISVKVDMEELAGWEANRITAFFSGVAQVLAAKGKIEERI